MIQMLKLLEMGLKIITIRTLKEMEDLYLRNFFMQKENDLKEKDIIAGRNCRKSYRNGKYVHEYK